MLRLFLALAAGCAAFAQDPGAQDWRRDLAAAREAYIHLNYAAAGEQAAAVVRAAGAEPGNEATVLEALRLLGGAQRSQGRYADASASFQRSVEVCAAVHGGQSLDEAGLLAEASAMERAQGRHAEAFDFIRKAIVIREAAPDLRPEDLGRDLTAAAALELKLGDKEQARARFQRAIEVWNAALPGDPRILPALEPLALMHRDAAEYAEAEPLLLQALKIREAAVGPDGAEVISVVDSLAYVYFGMKRFPEAEAFYKRLLDLWEKAAGPEHPMRALTLDKMAEFYAFQQRYTEGQKAAAEALAMRTRLHLASLNQTGRLMLMEARVEEAEDHYRRAIEIGDLARAPDDAMDPLLRVYAGILKELKKTTEAAAVEARVKDALIRKADREGRRPAPGQPPAPPPPPARQ